MPVARSGTRFMARFVKIDEASFERLRARAQKAAAAPHAVSVHFDRRNHEIKLVLSSGMTLSFDPWLAPDLYGLSDDDLAEVEVEGAGCAIRFPLRLLRLRRDRGRLRGRCRWAPARNPCARDSPKRHFVRRGSTTADSTASFISWPVVGAGPAGEPLNDPDQAPRRLRDCDARPLGREPVGGFGAR